MYGRHSLSGKPGQGKVFPMGMRDLQPPQEASFNPRSVANARKFSALSGFEKA